MVINLGRSRQTQKKKKNRLTAPKNPIKQITVMYVKKKKKKEPTLHKSIRSSTVPKLNETTKSLLVFFSIDATTSK